MRYAIPFLFLLAAPLFAQTPGSCERGTAEGDLDVGDVFARVFNTGALFFGNSTSSGYHVPKHTGNSPIFATVFWIGGLVNEEIRVAGARYTRYEMWPGPLNAGATLPNPSDCSGYDHIYVVSRDDVRHYLETGQSTDDLRDWPVAWGAPVLDGDGIEGNYNLAGGDQPAIYGDQTAWWVMNDVGNIHSETGSNPLGVEVQVSAFAVGSGIRALKEATFYRYVIANRSENVIDSAYVSLFVDGEVGGAGDDWMGSDTTYGLGFMYNSDNDDAIYGIPPAVGAIVPQGPVGLPNGRDDDEDGAVDEADERLGLTAVTHWCGSCTQPGTGDPRFAEEYYAQMRGRWKDGVPYTEYGFGYNTVGPITVFAFAGDPVADQCWSMANTCDGGPGPSLGSRTKFVIHSGPFQLGPGEKTEVVFALPFAQGTNHLDSVTKLREAAYSTRAAWQTGVLAPTRVEAQPLPNTFQLQVSAPFPNPFAEQTTIRYELPEPMRVRMTVYDALGRTVAVLVEGEQPAGLHEAVFNSADLAPGAYVVRFEAAGEERAFTMIKLR